MARPGEFELIERYFAPLSAQGSFNLIDDAALLEITPGKKLVLTQDGIAEGVHFLHGDPPHLIAAKALRVNLSDLAAKGAVPKGFSLALGLHPDWNENWVADFAEGLRQDCTRHDLSLTGGDTFTSPGGTVISITAFGEISPGQYASRLEAKPGERLYVTGTIGDAALGLKVRREEPDYVGLKDASTLLDSYLSPDPPVAFAPVIAEFASASLDISDGFAGDLAKLAKASCVSMKVDLAAIPFSPQVRSALEIDGALETALTGGDDFQILFTVPSERADAMEAEAENIGVKVSLLSDVAHGDGEVTINGLDSKPLSFTSLSWRHFSA